MYISFKGKVYRFREGVREGAERKIAQIEGEDWDDMIEGMEGDREMDGARQRGGWGGGGYLPIQHFYLSIT